MTTAQQTAIAMDVRAPRDAQEGASVTIGVPGTTNGPAERLGVAPDGFTVTLAWAGGFDDGLSKGRQACHGGSSARREGG